MTLLLSVHVGKGGVFRSIHGVGAVMTNMVLGSGLPHSPLTHHTQGASAASTAGGLDNQNKEDELVMETKLKIIQILQVNLSSSLSFNLLMRYHLTHKAGRPF